MKLLRPRAVPAHPDAAADAGADANGPSPESVSTEATVEGERGIPSINRAPSLQSRVSSVLAIGLMSALGLGLLTWYYAGAMNRHAREEQSAQSATKARAKGEMPLPPLGKIDWCRRLAKLVANFTHQRVDEESPLLSAALPGGERIQVVLPPATSAGTVAITIRRPSDVVWTIEQLAQRGIFRMARRSSDGLDATEEELLRLLANHEHEGFMRLAVRTRKNILVSGPTGSGKTTLTKALIREIPADERLITIEDASELVLDGHANHVRLFYSKDDQGLARVSPKQLLESCLRMKPDRILLAELRAEEAFDYLRNVNSGHPGSITSIHAASAELAFEQLVLLVKQSRGGCELARRDIKSLLYLLVDIVIQFGIERHERFIKEIWYEPGRKRRRMAVAA